MIWPGKHGNAERACYPEVGQKKPNRWGLYDMHGGVWEWCDYWYDADYYLTAPLVDPKGPVSGRFKVPRGGSWFRYGKYARSAYRRFFHPEETDYVTAYIQDFGCCVVINLDGEGVGVQGNEQRRSQSGPNVLRLAENLVKHKGNPVLDVGKPGAWDDQGLGCFSLAKADNQFMLLYMGAGKSNKGWQLGLATSPDGVQWRRSSANPVLGPGPCLAS